jgi:arylsulfatase A-like enzyme
MNKNFIAQRNFAILIFLIGIILSNGKWMHATEGLMSESSTKPNILLILSDQQHWKAMGHMDSFFDTPNLDAFAKTGIVFENAFCTTPQCSPSRSSLLTGFYPSSTGVIGNIGAAGGDFLEQPTIARELQAAGYYTGYFGKWHLGKNETAIRGWDKKEFKQNDSHAEKNAVNFLRKINESGQPFALFVSMVNPHDIYHFKKHEASPNVREIPLPLSWEKETLEEKPMIQKQFMLEDQGETIEKMPRGVWQKYRDAYRYYTKLFDNNIGAILDELKQQGHWDNTIIIITSDHGDMDTNHRLIYKGPFMYEHMMRVPFMMHIPKKYNSVQPRLISDVDIVNVDIVPTIRDFCGLEGKESHGISLMSLLIGSEEYKARDFVIGQYYSKQRWVNPIRMIRTTEFKLNRHIRYGDELYDLLNDPDELINLANVTKYAGIKTQLSKKLNQWIKQHKDTFYSLKTTSRSGEVFN